MIINFEETEEMQIERFYGGEKSTAARMFNDGQNRIMQGRLVPSASIGMHRHDSGSEIIYIIKGSGKAVFDGEYSDIKAGSVHYCPKGHEHSLINDGGEDLTFFAVVPKQ